VARQTRLPVYYLGGSIDPLVPWPLVRRWLRNNCPGYRGSKMLWMADHNVLATAPAVSADTVIQWIKKETSS
jgi:pimeloyl-ACP methyl ester carboxylesterase